MVATRTVLRTVGEGLAPVTDLLYPPRCPLCGGGIAAQDGLCAACWGQLAIPGRPACSLCQRPFRPDPALADDDAEVEATGVCAPCMASPPNHDGIAAGTLYNEASRRLVLSFKHGRRISLATMFARLIAARLPQHDEPWTFVPVPLHRGRLWARGYNQAALIADALHCELGGRLLVDGLTRTRRTPSLGGLGRMARRRTLRGAIAANPRREALIAGSNVLLVDDVLTSGATSETCVSVLKRAGADRVTIGCFARVLDEAL